MNQVDNTVENPSAEEANQAQAVLEPNDDSIKEKIDYSNLIKQFNRNMMLVTGLGLAFLLFQQGPNTAVPFLLGSALVWANMLMLAKGLGGVINGERSLVALLLLKFGILLGGVLGLSQLFPNQGFALILGCSTWVCSLMLIGKVKVTTQPIALLLVLFYSGGLMTAEAKPSEAEMLKGEVAIEVIDIPKSPMPKIIAEGIIKVDPKDLWAVISDCANFKKTMSNIMESKFLGYKNGFKRCELVVDLPFPLSNLRSVVDVTLKEDKNGYTRTWKLVEGDYHKNTGEWKLSKRPDGYTHLRYMVHVEPKVSIPDFIQRAAQKTKIPGIFEDLTELMEKRGKLLP